MSWLGKVFPYVGFLERRVEELRLTNQRLFDQLLRATGNEPIYEQRPFDSAQGKPVKTRQTMEDYLRRLEAEEQKLLQEEMAALAKEKLASN